MSASLIPNNSTILVTGGATGIGLALVKEFVGKGHNVIVAGRRQAKLDEVKAEVPQISTIRGDIGNDADRISLFEAVTRAHPEVNVLVNNAGVYISNGNVAEKSEWENFKQNLSINTEGTIHLSYLFADYFKSRPTVKALIVVVTSIVSFIPLASALGYSLSKAALHHFTVGFRLQLRGSNVSVAEAYPGPTLTDMLSDPGLRQIASTAESYAADTIRQLELGHTEFGQAGTPFETISRASWETVDGYTQGFNPLP